MQGRHGHSMSLVNPGSLPPPVFNTALGSNPFGPQAVLGSDDFIVTNQLESQPILRLPPQQSPGSSLSPGLIERSRPNSRPDFVVGFGLEIPEEEEPEEELMKMQELEDMRSERSDSNGSVTADETENEEEEEMEQGDDAPRSHLGHRTRLSASLSLRSVGGHRESLTSPQFIPPTRSPIGSPAVDDLDADDVHTGEIDTDAIGEWTGSEDPQAGGASSDEVCTIQDYPTFKLSDIFAGKHWGVVEPLR